MNGTKGYYARTPHAIRLESGGRWYIAVETRASGYGDKVLKELGIDVDAYVWCDPETTALLCLVGKEQQSIELT